MIQASISRSCFQYNYQVVCQLCVFFFSILRAVVAQNLVFCVPAVPHRDKTFLHLRNAVLCHKVCVYSVFSLFSPRHPKHWVKGFSGSQLLLGEGRIWKWLHDFHLPSRESTPRVSTSRLPSSLESFSSVNTCRGNENRRRKERLSAKTAQ